MAASCDPSQFASDECLQSLAALDCDLLAAPIRAAGWDRAPTPEMERAIERYAQDLTTRYLSCRWGGELGPEEAAIREQYEAMHVSYHVGMMVTTGQCTLQLDELQACKTSITAASCDDLGDLAKRSQLDRFCSQFLDCSEEPEEVQQVMAK